MVESFLPLFCVQLLPHAGVNLSADAADIQHLLDTREGFRVHPNAGDVIIPAGMLAEGGQREPRLRGFRRGTSGCAHKTLENVFHRHQSEH